MFAGRRLVFGFLCLVWVQQVTVFPRQRSPDSDKPPPEVSPSRARRVREIWAELALSTPVFFLALEHQSRVLRDLVR